MLLGNSCILCAFIPPPSRALIRAASLGRGTSKKTTAVFHRSRQQCAYCLAGAPMLRRPCARHNASAALIKGVPANAVEFGYRVRVSALQFTLGLHLASLVGYYGAARSASALYFFYKRSQTTCRPPAAGRDQGETQNLCAVSVIGAAKSLFCGFRKPIRRTNDHPVASRISLLVIRGGRR